MGIVGALIPFRFRRSARTPSPRLFLGPSPVGGCWGSFSGVARSSAPTAALRWTAGRELPSLAASLAVTRPDLSALGGEAAGSGEVRSPRLLSLPKTGLKTKSWPVGCHSGTQIYTKKKVP